MADKTLKSITFVEGGDVYYPLPKVTNADDDKILMVVNGVWAAAAITNAEGVKY